MRAVKNKDRDLVVFKEKVETELRVFKGDKFKEFRKRMFYNIDNKIDYIYSHTSLSVKCSLGSQYFMKINDKYLSKYDYTLLVYMYYDSCIMCNADIIIDNERSESYEDCLCKVCEKSDKKYDKKYFLKFLKKNQERNKRLLKKSNILAEKDIPIYIKKQMI